VLTAEFNGGYNDSMENNYCYLHEDRIAGRVCKKCGKYFCNYCGGLTEYSGNCLVCEKQELKASISKVQDDTRASLLKTISGALSMVIFVLVAILAERAQIIGLVLGLVSLGIFAYCLANFIANGNKLKKQRRVYDAVEKELNCLLERIRAEKQAKKPKGTE
jgi:hypothetical protein